MFENSLEKSWLDFILGYCEQSYQILLDAHIHEQGCIKPKNKATEEMYGLIGGITAILQKMSHGFIVLNAK